jgi:hypothetical protein
LVPTSATTPDTNHGIGGRAAAVPESFRLESRADSGPSTTPIGAGNMTRDSLTTECFVVLRIRWLIKGHEQPPLAGPPRCQSSQSINAMDNNCRINRFFNLINEPDQARKAGHIVIDEALPAGRTSYYGPQGIRSRYGAVTEDRQAINGKFSEEPTK